MFAVDITRVVCGLSTGCWQLIQISIFSAKTARLKQAKEEADKEIAEFRARIEADFQRKLAEVSILREESVILLLEYFLLNINYFQFLENIFSLFV